MNKREYKKNGYFHIYNDKYENIFNLILTFNYNNVLVKEKVK